MNTVIGRNRDLRTIAVVGFSARSATQCAIRQGFEVIAVDLCADRDLISQCKKHYRLDDPNWPDALNELHPGVPLLLTGGMEHRTQWVDRCHMIANRCGPHGKQLSSTRSLDNWEKWATTSKLGWPVTICEIQDSTILQDRFAGGDWLLKPFHGAGGIGIIDLTDAVPLSVQLLKKLNKVYIQKRLPGVTVGITFLSSEFGSTLAGATAAWPPDSKPPTSHYIYRGSWGPIPLTDEQIDKLQGFADVVGRESGLRGLWQADFLVHEGLLSLLEINPRWSASMDILDICLDLRLVKMHYECICSSVSRTTFEQFAGERCKQAKESIEMLGKLIVYARNGFAVTQTQSDHWWANRWKCDMQAIRDERQFADIPFAGTTVAKGDPILTVLTSGQSHESILCDLQSANLEMDAS